jgi:hypothetical protein
VIEENVRLTLENEKDKEGKIVAQLGRIADMLEEAKMIV